MAGEVGAQGRKSQKWGPLGLHTISVAEPWQKELPCLGGTEGGHRSLG